MILIPNKEDVREDGSLEYGVVATDNRQAELLTDLRDIDFTNLKNIQPGYIGLLSYQPNKNKKFSFVLMKDPRFTAITEKDNA